MKEVIYKCDICGKETDPDLMIHTASGHDVCAGCLEKLVNDYFKPKAREELSYTPAKKEKKPPIDFGKAQALRNAGWSVPKIAKELGCCEATVYAKTLPAQEKKQYEHEWAEDDQKRMEAGND